MFFGRVLDALQVAWTTHGLYFYLIDMFGDLSSVLSHSVWYVPGKKYDVNSPSDNMKQELQSDFFVVTITNTLMTVYTQLQIGANVSG